MSRSGPRSRASFLGILLLPLLVPGVSSAQPVAIEHESVACIVAEQFPVLDACFRPGPKLARARVYFRPEGVPNWYYIEASRPAPTRVTDPPDRLCRRATLPRPKKSLLQKHVEYYVDAVGKGLESSQTETYRPLVVKSRSECKDKPFAAFIPDAAVSVLPSLPAGFAGAGGLSGTTVAAVVGAGVAGVTGTVVAVTGGGGNAPVTSTTQPLAPTTQPSGVIGTTTTSTLPSVTPTTSTTTTSTLPSPPTTSTTTTTTTTLPGPCSTDVTPPAVTLTSPTVGLFFTTLLPGSFPVPFRATATDLNGVAQVEYLLDVLVALPGGPTGLRPIPGAVSSTPSNYPFAWSSAAASSFLGPTCTIEAVVVAKATDNCGNVGTASNPGIITVSKCLLVPPVSFLRRPDEIRSEPPAQTPAGWVSQLEVPGGRGQVVLNGSQALFPSAGRAVLPVRVPSGENRVEATVVQAQGRPGLWRFELGLSVEPGSLRVIAGEAALVTADAIGFRFKGRPGERVVFTFRAQR